MEARYSANTTGLMNTAATASKNIARSAMMKLRFAEDVLALKRGKCMRFSLSIARLFTTPATPEKNPAAQSAAGTGTIPHRTNARHSYLRRLCDSLVTSGTSLLSTDSLEIAHTKSSSDPVRHNLLLEPLQH